MQQKQTFIAIIVMLVIAFVITLTGWVKARNELIAIKSGQEFEQPSSLLSICDNIQNSADEQACAEQLQEFSRLLTVYEQKLRGLQNSTQ